MKRIVSLLIVIVMTIFLTSCKNTNVVDEPVVILGAMECEIELIAESLDNMTESKVGNATLYTGTYKGIPIVAIYCLSGMVNASSITTYAINELKPCMVIIQGTAGGHNKDLHQGDIVLGENLVELGNYFSPHRGEGEGSVQANWDYPGAEMVYDDGETVRTKLMHSSKQLLEVAQNVEYDYGQVVLGTHGTGDQWNKELDLINFYHEKLGTDCEEMEGFAVGQVCTMYNIPFLAIRIISNSELYPEEIFDEKYGEYCQQFTLDVVEQYYK